MVSNLERAQMVFRTKTGELVSSTRLTFDGVTNEYMTVTQLAWLLGYDVDECIRFLMEGTVRLRELHGQTWVNVCNCIPLFGWTLG